MKRAYSVFLLLFICTFSSFGQNIKIAAAANTQFAIKDLIKAFEKEVDFKVDPIIGSSGKLVAQISNGAPYHIFISANMKYATHVFKEGHAACEPIIYAKGSGVLWTTKNNVDISNGLSAVLNDNIKTIAIASPKNAPYGLLAVKALKEAGYYDKIETKLVFGSSVSQVNQYVTLGTVDLGITAKSIVMSPALKNTGKWIDIKGQYIDQGMIMLKYSKTHEQENTQKFYDFLQSDTAREIFEEYGYIVD